MRLSAAIALAALFAASPVQAKTLDKLPAKLNPTKAYAVVEVGNLDDARAKGVLTLARYDTSAGDIAFLDKAAKKPVLAHESLGKPLVQEKSRRLYLLELVPGQWVIEGANGTAFSLGSRTFELVAGQVTDLGIATVTTDYAEGESAYKLTAGKALKLGLFGAFAGGSALPQPIPTAVNFRARAANDLVVPKLATEPVEWGAEVKFGNYLGGLVNRMGGRKDRPETNATVSTPAAEMNR